MTTCYRPRFLFVAYVSWAQRTSFSYSGGLSEKNLTFLQDKSVEKNVDFPILVRLVGNLR